MTKFLKDDKVICIDTRNDAKHLQWNKIYEVAWCNASYVRLKMSMMREGGGIQATMFSVDRFEKVA